MLDRDDLSHLAIPDFLLRDDNNQLVNKRMSESVETVAETPAPKAKANGAAKPAAKAAAKATGKPKAKAATKAPTKKAAPKAAPKAAKKASKDAKPKAPHKPVAEKDQFGLRKGSAKSEAAAMYARKSGATLAEVKDKVGSIQLNVLNALEEQGHKVVREKVERKGERPVTRYYLTPKK